jgi:hypothetical protein
MAEKATRNLRARQVDLHVHHLYRTTEEPWDEPNLHLLTLCRLCHEQQLSNPRGGFKHPKRLYKTDAEWWEEHRHAYDEQIQEELDVRNVSGFTQREVMQKLGLVKDRIHALRLVWDAEQKEGDALPRE